MHITDIDGANASTALRVRQGSASYDAYGNVLSATVATQGGVSSEVRSTYEVRANDWIISLVSTRELYATEPDAPGPTPPRRTAYGYDARGLLCHVFIEKDHDSPSIPEVLTFARDAEGLVRAITASAALTADRTMHFAYEPTERVFQSEVWNDLGHAHGSLIHPALGVALAEEDANGVVTRLRYDDLGRTRAIVPAGRAATTIDYALHEGGLRVTASMDSNGATWTDRDELGRVVGEGHTGFDGTPIEQVTRFDALGRVVSVSRPSFGVPASDATTFAYDNLDRLIAEVAPDHATRTLTHTFFTTRAIDAMQRETRLTRDVDDRVIRSAAFDSGAELPTAYHYTSFGLVDRITDPAGNTTVLGYDARGRRSSIDDPDAGSRVVQYNGLGDVTAEWRNGELTRTFPDVLGRTTRIERGDEVTTLAWDTSPHGRGKLASTTSPDGVVETRSYDAAERLTGQTWTIDGEPFAIGRAYDAQDRLTQITYPEVGGSAPLTVGYRYTPASGALEEVYDAATLASFFRVDARNSDDALTAARFGNGVTSARSYDGVTGRLKSLQEGSALALAYDYYADGRVYHRDDALTGRDEEFSYDTVGRLERWAVTTRIPGPPGLPDGLVRLRAEDYRYDALGNLTKVFVDGTLHDDNVYGTNGRPHALTQTTGGALFYDDHGRQEDAPGRSIIWNGLDLPATVTTPQGKTVFAYDGVGARVKKSGPSGVIVSLAGLYERRAPGGQVEHVFYVHGSEGPVAQVSLPEGGDRAVRYLHTDPLGSIGATTDADGKAEALLYYTPFGARRDVDGAPVGGAPKGISLGFTGRVHDEDLGLIDLRGRVYDPGIRRFVTPDPHVTDVLDGQSFNRYSYVGNDPVNRIDPTGFDWWPSPDASQGCLIWGCGGWDGGPIDGHLAGSATPSGALSSAASPAGGSSAPAIPPGNQVMAFEERRPVNLPTGPSAPGAPAAGPSTPAPAGGAAEASTSSWKDNAIVQGVAGFVGGVAIGIVPGGAVGEQVLTATKVLAEGTRAAQAGKSLGEMVGGAVATVGGASGTFVGGGLSLTGGGALFGVPAVAVSAGVVTGGLGNMAAGLRGLSEALMMKGEGGSTRAPAPAPTPQASNPPDPNKLHHIFGRAKHNLGSLVDKFGSQEATFRAVEDAAQAAVRTKGLSGVFETTVTVADSSVVVRGTVVDGAAKIGSFWIP